MVSGLIAGLIGLAVGVVLGGKIRELAGTVGIDIPSFYADWKSSYPAIQYPPTATSLGSRSSFGPLALPRRVDATSYRDANETQHNSIMIPDKEDRPVHRAPADDRIFGADYDSEVERRINHITVE